jgi:hypothetical protein
MNAFTHFELAERVALNLLSDHTYAADDEEWLQKATRAANCERIIATLTILEPENSTQKWSKPRILGMLREMQQELPRVAA